MLILVPTTLELRGLFPEIADAAARAPARWMTNTSLGEPADVARCGFGLSAAGARAAVLMARRDDDACLAGLGGTFEPAEAPVGSIVVASRVQVDGIGFGLGKTFLHPADIAGPLQAEWRGQAAAAPWIPPVAGLRGGLLSVASSSGNPADAAARHARFASCLVEEMEADAVLHAASALGRRVAVVRAISNVAGDREPSRWAVAPALAALRRALEAWLTR